MAKEYRLITIRNLEELLKMNDIDLFYIKKRIIKEHYSHLTKFLLRKEFDNELIHEDAIWLRPTILEARESGCHKVAELLAHALEALETYYKVVEESKKFLGKMDSLIQTADGFIKLGSVEEANKLLEEIDRVDKDFIESQRQLDQKLGLSTS